MPKSFDFPQECQHCGSTLVYRYGIQHCTGDNTLNIQEYFNNLIDLEVNDIKAFNESFTTLQHKEETLDLFITYWGLVKSDNIQQVNCPFNEDIKIAYTSVGDFKLPMPSSSVPLPDLAEVYLAEHMLGRELTHNEKVGTRYIPKINESGDLYFAPLKWLEYPHNFSTDYKDLFDKTDYDSDSLEAIFDFNAIKGIYSNRTGDINDD